MKKSPKPGDMNQRMYAVVQQAAGLSEQPETPEKDPAAVVRGRLGGQARARALTPRERVDIARKARAERTRRSSGSLGVDDDESQPSTARPARIAAESEPSEPQSRADSDGPKSIARGHRDIR